LKAYRQAQELLERLAKVDEGHLTLQEALADCYYDIAKILVDQGNVPEAIKSFRESRDVLERLVKARPSNIELQGRLSARHLRLAMIYRRQGQIKEAREELAVGRPLVPDDVGWKRTLAEFDRQILELDEIHAYQQALLASQAAFKGGDYAKAVALQQDLVNEV